MLERLPFELGEAVYEHAGLTTQLLHGRLPLPLDDRTSALVWIECMANDLVGCVPMLPQRNLTFEPYLAPPSDAIVAAIRARPDMAPFDHSLSDAETQYIRAAMFSLETCRLLLQSQLRIRVEGRVDEMPKTRHGPHWLVMLAAAGVGDTATMQSIVDARGRLLRMNLVAPVAIALAYDQTKSIEQLLPHLPRPARLVPKAIEANAVKCFEMLASQFGLSCVSRHCILLAARDNHDSILTWLIEHHGMLSQTQMQQLASVCAKYRRIDLLRAFSSNGIRLRMLPYYAARAAVCGDMELFGVLRPHLDGDDWFNIAMRIAAGKGNLDAVRRLHSDFDLACDHSAMDAAAAGGHMDVIEFLRTHRTEGFSGAAMIVAARGGHLGVVRFLHEQQIECNDTVAMDCAARNGHIDVLEFLGIERGARCSRNAFLLAVRQRMFPTLTWLLAHYPDTPVEDLQAGLQEALRIWSQNVTSSIVRHNPKVADAEVARRLLRRRWFDSFRIVIESGHFVPSSEMLTSVIATGNLEIVRLLIDSGARLNTVDTASWTRCYFPYEKQIFRLLFERFPDMDWSKLTAHGPNVSSQLAEFVKSLIAERDAGAAQPGQS
ncbi:hypothetical protein HK105_201301 [Polyrhizophydium stewartii]|uniref:Ankyrin repeat protein n=1 Tax=Polyrhizophydium stewartii TaxID=2732419 RepID=A0ABR4NHQ2_9FUNG